LIDPAESKVVLPFLNNFPEHKISHVFYTHKHWDHVGDSDVLLKELRARYESDLNVVGSEADKIPERTISIKDKHTFEINDIQVTCFPTPCHTMGALCYYFEDKNHIADQNDTELIKKQGTECVRCVFTGDTHFVGGCGKFFEGDAKMMQKNLDTLAELPKDTFVFPGHEYTEGNLNWALGIEWENEAYVQKLE
jgi:hydroxyacylglutathione hydrolase